MSPAATLLIAIAVCVVLTAIALALTANGRRGRHTGSRAVKGSGSEAPQEPAPAPPRAAIVVNPTKFPDLDEVRRSLDAAAQELGWAPPVFTLTTQDDPGAGQAADAIEDKVDLVCSLGGDGTVRMVATALAGTDTPLGLLPGGTGNLLARNLDLPYGDVVESFRIACTGRERAVDVGYLTLDPAGGDAPGEEHAFLVMAGIGLDATIMAETSEAAKAKIGWPAYAATGLRNFLGPRLRATVTIDGGQPEAVHAHTVLVGNCGRITGGLNLIPDALVDDGVLDVVVVAPRTLIGWLEVLARVLTQHRGERNKRLQRHTGTRVQIATPHPQAVQLDGDVIGEATRVSVRIAPSALRVRVPGAA